MQVSKYFTLEDFCICTITYQKYAEKINCYPTNLKATVLALQALSQFILEPIVDYFGRDKFQLTYGFCSPDLKKYLQQFLIELDTVKEENWNGKQMKAYSVDLRQKIVDAYNQREGSQRQLARRFRVSLTFIENLLKRYRTDGTVEPRAHGGGQVAKLSQEQEAVVATLVEENNDAILVELCDKLEQRVGVRISRATMGRYVQKLKLTRKKNSTRNRARNRTSSTVESPVLA